jgi:hypothetical protein
VLRSREPHQGQFWDSIKRDPLTRLSVRITMVGLFPRRLGYSQSYKTVAPNSWIPGPWLSIMEPSRLDALDVVISWLRQTPMNGKYSCVLKTLLPIQFRLAYVIRPPSRSCPPGNMRFSAAMADFFCPGAVALLESENFSAELNPRLMQSYTRNDRQQYITQDAKSILCWCEMILFGRFALQVRWPDP